MYERWLPKRIRLSYRQCRHKPRIDRRATDLIRLVYAKSTVTERLSAWVDFALRYDDSELLRIPAMPIGHSGRCRSPVPARRSPVAGRRWVGLRRGLLALGRVAFRLPERL